jgi:hypothetical protein
MDINAAMIRGTAHMINTMGKLATYTPQGGSPKAITILFDDEYLGLDLEAGSVSTTGPAAYCKSEDITDAQKGDSFTVDGTSYTVRDPPQPDGTGMEIVMLKKA